MEFSVCVRLCHKQCLLFLIHLDGKWFRFLSHHLLGQVTHELSIVYHFAVHLDQI